MVLEPDPDLSWAPANRPAAGGALFINIFGGPGSGKSTLASELFCGLKKAGIEAACPEEHAKLALWSGQDWVLDEQTILLGRTWETISALADKAEVVIIDSPILLSSVYAGDREPLCFHDLVFHLHGRMDRVNLLLERNDDLGYSTNGRRENETEARRVDGSIASLLRERGEPFVPVSQGALIVEAVTALARRHRAQ